MHRVPLPPCKLHSVWSGLLALIKDVALHAGSLWKWRHLLFSCKSKGEGFFSQEMILWFYRKLVNGRFRTLLCLCFVPKTRCPSPNTQMSLLIILSKYLTSFKCLWHVNSQKVHTYFKPFVFPLEIASWAFFMPNNTTYEVFDVK